MTHPIKKLLFYIIAICIAQSCLANNLLKFEPIPKKDYPALVFMEEDTNPDPNLLIRGTLYVAAIKDGKVNCQKIISSQYVQTTQISDSIFLIRTNESNLYSKKPIQAQLQSQSIYLADFNSGSSVLLSTSNTIDKMVHFFCIYTDLYRNKAVFLRYGQGTENPQLYELDLNNLEQKLLYTTPKEKINLPYPQVKMSNDYRHLAFVERSSKDFKTFTLKIVDLKTMTVSELDKNIKVQVSGFSSELGQPPFEWVSNNEILYQNMLPSKDESRSFMYGTYILKCINIETKKTTDWIRQELRLTGDGGSLKLNPFTGNIEYMVYEGRYIIDVKKHSLIPQKPDFSIVGIYDKPSEVYYKNKSIYKGYCSPFTCISHSANNFALVTDFNTRHPIIQAVINGNEKLIQIREVPNNTIYPGEHFISWIEDTSSLRKK